MELAEIRRVVDVWAEQFDNLAALPWVRNVAIFENRGAAMGASNAHPHGQIWATEHMPNEPAKELRQVAAYREHHGGCLLCDYLKLEMELGQRIVVANSSFAALVPFWAVWPFEVLVLPRHHLGALPDLDSDNRADLALVLSLVLRRYDALFATPFPYSMGFHQRPATREEKSTAHLHLHFLPPLLRSGSIRKFMVGYELLCEPQRDITPEAAAEALREVDAK